MPSLFHVAAAAMGTDEAHNDTLGSVLFVVLTLPLLLLFLACWREMQSR